MGKSVPGNNSRQAGGWPESAGKGDTIITEDRLCA